MYNYNFLFNFSLLFVIHRLNFHDNARFFISILIPVPISQLPTNYRLNVQSINIFTYLDNLISRLLYLFYVATGDCMLKNNKKNVIKKLLLHLNCNLKTELI